MTLDSDQEMTLTLINCIHLLVVCFCQAAIVSKISVVFTFIQAYVSKTDLAVQLVKVIPGSSFEQTVMGCSPRYYIPSFVKISQPVLEKKISEGILPYMGVAAILAM